MREMIEAWWTAAGVGAMLSEAAARHLPTAFKLLAVLLAGWLATRFVERTARWFAVRMKRDERCVQWRIAPMLRRIGCKSAEDALPRKVRWLGGALVLYILSELLQIKALSQLFAALFAMLPALAAASAIVLGGLALSELVREALRKVIAAQAPDHELQEIAPSAVAVVILVVSATLAAEQLGLDVWLIHAVLLLTVAALCVGLTLGVALGAVPLLRQLIARYYVTRAYERDDVLECDGVRGRIRRFGPTMAVLELDSDPERRALIPYDKLVRHQVRRVSKRT